MNKQRKEYEEFNKLIQKAGEYKEERQHFIKKSLTDIGSYAKQHKDQFYGVQTKEQKKKKLVI